MSESFEFLTAQLKNADRLIQARAATLLGSLGNTDAIDPLLDYVSNCRYHSKTAGFYALADLLDEDHPAVETLLDLADEPNCEDDNYWIGHKSVRAAASLALLKLGEAYGEEYLSELAKSLDLVMYNWFAPAILSLEPEIEAIERLQSCLTVSAIYRPDENFQTTLTEPGSLAMVCEALGIIGNEHAKLALLELMEHRSRYVRGAAVLALAEIASNNEQRDAIAYMADNGESDFERIRAAEAMCIMGNEQYAELLMQMARSAEIDSDRAAAIEAIARVDAERETPDPEAVKLFVELLGDSAASVRAAAIESLDNGGVYDDMKVIKSIFANDDNTFVKMQAAAMLALRE